MGLASPAMEDNSQMNQARNHTANIEARLRQIIDATPLSMAQIVSLANQSPNHLSLGPICEQINCEAIRLAVNKQGPSPLLYALGRLSLHYLCATAAETHYHTTTVVSQEEQIENLCALGPIWRYNKILFAVPIGSLHWDGLLAFLNRLVQTIDAHLLKKQKIKCIHLILKNLHVSKSNKNKWLRLLREELNAKKISLKLDE